MNFKKIRQTATGAFGCCFPVRKKRTKFAADLLSYMVFILNLVILIKPRYPRPVQNKSPIYDTVLATQYIDPKTRNIYSSCKHYFVYITFSLPDLYILSIYHFTLLFAGCLAWGAFKKSLKSKIRASFFRTFFFSRKVSRRSASGSSGWSGTTPSKCSHGFGRQLRK